MYERSDGAQIPQALHVFDFVHKLKAENSSVCPQTFNSFRSLNMTSNPVKTQPIFRLTSVSVQIRKRNGYVNFQ